MNSVISETPGPDVHVNARAPFQPAPVTMPIDAISSSACTIANLFLPLALSTRSLRAVLLERLGDRRDRRDRVPGADRRAAVHAAERRGRVAFHEDALADRVAPLDLQPEHVAEVLLAVMQAHHEGVEVRLDQLGLALVLLAEQRRDHLGLDAQHRREHADVDDVLEQLPFARVGVARRAEVGQRHAEHVDVVAEFARRHRLAAVVHQVAAGLDLGDVLVPGLRVHRDHQVDAAAPAEVAVLVDAHLVPGRQALDVAREDVARAHRHAHAQQAAREHLVGRGRARAVDVRELDDEIVDRVDARPLVFWSMRLGPQAAFFATAPPRSGRGGSRGRPASGRAGTSACPTRRSGSVRRTARSAGRRLRPSPSRGRSSDRSTRTAPDPHAAPARAAACADRLRRRWR